MKQALAGSGLAVLLLATGMARAQSTLETWMVTGSGSGAAPDERGPDDDRPVLERPIPQPVERFEPASRFEPDGDRDGDGIVDRDDACVDRPETVNGVNDHDGCPDSASIQMTQDRVVIDGKSFFEYDEATVRPEGQRKLDEIATLYRAHGSDWKTLRVMGHADRRGPMPYNLDLSRRRAAAVRDYLVAQGIPSSVIDIEAYGETRPAVPNADTEREFQMNRRVEFRIVRD